MADNAGADHVGNEFVFAAIPGEEDGTRAAAAVEFSKRMKFFGGQIYFILRDAGRPEQAHDFDIFFGAKSAEERCGVLAQVTGGAGDFPFLIERACVDFHFCADGGFVIAERFQIDMHPVVFGGAFTVKDDGRTAQLCYDEVSSALAARVRKGQSTRLSKFDGVEMRVFGDVGPTLISQIAEKAKFAAVAGFACGDDVEPAVIIVIDGRDSPSALPSEIGERDTLEFFSVYIAPQADSGRARVGEGEVHPAVFIKVKSDHADGWRKIFFFKIDDGEWSEFTFARI